MQKTLRLALLILGIAALVPALRSAEAYETAAIQLEFNPKKDSSIRSMFQLALTGDQVSPGVKDQIDFGDYLIGTVYKDTTLDSLLGLNRHRITFYEYNSRASDLLNNDVTDNRFGGSNSPDLPKNGGDNGGGGPGGGGSGGPGGGGKKSMPDPNDNGLSGAGAAFLQSLNLPGGSQGSPLQGPPGGGGGGGGEGGGGNGGGGNGGNGGKAGKSRGLALSLDTTQINSLDYVENKRGEVLDVTGLDTLRKVSKAHLVNSENKGDEDINYININVSNVFEWNHLLYVPDYPVFKDDVWFHSYPVHVPGLPDDQPVMTKFIYSVVDFRTVGTRKLAVIDMSGISEWNMKWEDRNQDELTEFKSWGKMGITTRYWFDYEKGQIFGMERPPFVDYQYGRGYGARQRNLHPFYQIPPQIFDMRFPGQVVTMEFFYNTRVSDVSGKPRLVAEPPKEQRRFIDLIINNQMESE